MAEGESGGASARLFTPAGTVRMVPVLGRMGHALLLILRQRVRAPTHAPILVVNVGVEITVLLLDLALAGTSLVVLHLDHLFDRVLGILRPGRQSLQDTGYFLCRDPGRQALQHVRRATAAATPGHSYASGKGDRLWIQVRVRVLGQVNRPPLRFTGCLVDLQSTGRLVQHLWITGGNAVTVVA